MKHFKNKLISNIEYHEDRHKDTAVYFVDTVINEIAIKIETSIDTLTDNTGIEYSTCIEVSIRKNIWIKISTGIIYTDLWGFKGKVAEYIDFHSLDERHLKAYTYIIKIIEEIIENNK